MTNDSMQQYRQRIRYYLDSPGAATPEQRREGLARWIDREIRLAAERSICCDAPMSGGVQCLVCGADGTDEGEEG